MAGRASETPTVCCISLDYQLATREDEPHHVYFKLFAIFVRATILLDHK